MNHIVSVTELAEILGVEVRRVNQLAKSGIIDKVAHGKYELSDCVSRYISFLKKGRKEDGEESNDQSDLNPRYERARMYKAQAEKLEMDNAVTKKEYIHSSEVRNFLLEFGNLLVSQIDALPGRLSSSLSEQLNVETAQIYTLLKDETTSIREEISFGLTIIANHTRTQSENSSSSKTSSVGLGGATQETP